MRVIHPLLLTEGKFASLRGLPQGDRQDTKHLRLLILILNEWLTEQLEQPKAVFRAVERLAACAARPDGVHVFTHGIDLLDSLPLNEMRAAEDFSAFFDQRLDQVLQRIDRKRQRHRDALDEQ